MEPVRSNDDVEWTKLLWEEWKYRHESFWNKFYRAVWAVFVCAAAPWIRIDKFGVDLFSKARMSLTFRWGYIVFVIIFFWGTAALLSFEHVKLKLVEEKIRAIKGEKYRPEETSLSRVRAEFANIRIAISASLYLIVANILLIWWAWYFVRHAI